MSTATVVYSFFIFLSQLASVLYYHSSSGLKPWATGKSGNISTHTVRGYNSAHTHTHMVLYTVGGGVCDGLAYQSVRVCEFVCEHAYVYLLYDGWWMVWWVYFTYRMACSVKRSGLIAFSQWTAGLSGWCGVDSFAGSIINILEKIEITCGIFDLTLINTS